MDPGEEKDPSYDPAEEDVEEKVDEEEDCDKDADNTYVLQPSADIGQQKKFIVFESSLHSLLSQCRVCGRSYNVTYKEHGSLISCTMECQNGHNNEWSSQPKHHNMAWGNFLLCASILFSGSSPSKVLLFLSHFKIPAISVRTFTTIQRAYLIPCINSLWAAKQNTLIAARKDHKLVLGGDSR